MPASSTGGRHPPGLVETPMGKTLRGGEEEEVEQENESHEDDNEAHEIANHCISEMSEPLWKLSPLGVTQLLTASSPVIAISSMTLDP